MRFGAPHWLQLLWLLPLLAAWVIWSLRRRERDLARWCPPALQGRMTPSRRTWAGQARLVLLLLGVLFLVLAAARPQVGSRVLSVKRSGIDVIVALDLSESMLAEDLKPNRVTRARQEIQSLIDRLRGDRIGLVAFAGDAFVQCPLTLDYASARMFLRFMDTDLVPVPGTAIARAIEVATDSFEKSEDKFKALVLITDGEDHEGEVDAAVQKAKEAGVRIFAVGIGTQKGEPIPVRDDHGQLKDYKRDAKGEVILSQCDPAQLESICRATGGRYVDGSAGGLALDRLHGEIQGMEQKEMEGGVVTQYEDRYGYFVAAGFFFLVLEWLLSDRRRRRLSLARAAVLALVAAGAVAGGARADDGKKLYEKGSYPEARDHYERYNAEHPQDARGDYDLGTTLHRTGELKPAEDALQRALRSDDPEIRSRAFYNLGNTQAKQGDLPAALESYKNALRINPNDPDAKFNLELVDHLLQSSPPDSSQQNQQQNQQNQQNKDQQDQNQQDQNQQDQDQQNQDQQQDQQQDQNQQQDQQQEQDQQNQDQDQQQSEDQQQAQQNPQDEQDQKEQDQQQGEQQQDQDKDEQKGQAGEQSDEEKKDQAQNTMPQPQDLKISPEEARRILEALQQQEVSLQAERMKAKSRSTKVEKDW